MQALGSLDKPKPWLKFVSLIYCVVGWILLPISKFEGFTMVDFRVYYEAGLKVLAHQTVYDVVGHHQFKYSPFVAFLFSRALPWLSEERAAALFTGASLLTWGACLAFFVSSVKRRLTGARPSLSNIALMLALFIIFFNNAFYVELAYGQINLITLALCYLLFEFYKNNGSWRRNLALGFLFSLAMQLKLYALIFVPFFIFRRSWKLLFSTFLATVIMGGLILSLFEGWTFAWSEHVAWIKSLTTSSEGLLYTGYNVGILGTLRNPREPTLVNFIVWAGAIFVFLVLQYLLRKRDAFVSLCFALAAIVLLNPLVWSYWVLFCAPALLWVLQSRILRMPKKNPAELAVWISFAPLCFLLNAHGEAALRNVSVPLCAILISWYLLREVKLRGDRGA